MIASTKIDIWTHTDRIKIAYTRLAHNATRYTYTAAVNNKLTVNLSSQNKLYLDNACPEDMYHINMAIENK